MSSGTGRKRNQTLTSGTNEYDDANNLMVSPGSIIIERFDDYTEWTALSAKATTIASSTTHKTGATAISFSAGATAPADEVGIYKDISPAINLSGFDTSDTIEFNVNLSATTNLTSIIVKLGSSASNHIAFTQAVAGLSSGWNILKFIVSDGVQAGTGWNQSAISYISVEGVFGAAQTTTIILDYLNLTQTTDVGINISATGLATEATLSTINTNIANLTSETWTDTDLVWSLGKTVAGGFSLPDTGGVKFDMNGVEQIDVTLNSTGETTATSHDIIVEWSKDDGATWTTESKAFLVYDNETIGVASPIRLTRQSRYARFKMLPNGGTTDAATTLTLEQVS